MSYYDNRDPTSRISPEDLHYIAETQRRLAYEQQRNPHHSSTPHSSRRSSSAANGPSISLDPRALAQLSAHFDGLMQAIEGRVLDLSERTLTSTQAHNRRAHNLADRATMEAERLREILRHCDELQNELLKIRRIGEIVKGFRQRVETLEQRLGRS